MEQRKIVNRISQKNKVLQVSLQYDVYDGIKKVSQEQGISMAHVIERLCIDAGLAQRFFKPNRWGEVLGDPISGIAHTHTVAALKKEILLAKYEKELTFESIKKMNKHIKELDLYIASQINKLKSSDFIASQKDLIEERTGSSINLPAEELRNEDN